MIGLRNTSCCGIGDIEMGRNNAEQVLIDLEKRMTKPRADNYSYNHIIKKAFYLISDRVSTKKIPDIVKLITDNKLGEVTQTSQAKNPNSGRLIEAVLFKPDLLALTEWANKQTALIELSENKKKLEKINKDRETLEKLVKDGEKLKKELEKSKKITKTKKTKDVV